tara:strand:- start:79 stop:453 length:375 start_codon:yes stop_codon:yes gene_type:complete
MLRIMQYYTIVGAGTFGLVHLLKPSLITILLDAPANSIILGDMFIASVFLAFAIAGILTLKAPEKYASIASFQGYYKSLWCTFFIGNFVAGSITLTLFSVIYFMIMLSYAIGDYMVFNISKNKN